MKPGASREPQRFSWRRGATPLPFHLPDGAEQQSVTRQMAAWSGLSPRRAAIFGFDAERLETAEFV